MNSKLKTIINFMQQEDHNGTWNLIEEDIQEGNTTLEAEVIYMLETLTDWRNDMQEKNVIDEYIGYLMSLI